MKPSFLTKIDLKSFILGFVIALIIVLIFEWKDAVQGFKDGWNGVKSEESK
jgi:hypothetical protein